MDFCAIIKIMLAFNVWENVYATMLSEEKI